MRSLQASEPVADFSLLGGPLHRLGCRVGLVRNRTDTVVLGLVLGTLPWLILLVLSLVEGLVPTLFSIAAIGASVRLLVAIPLFFLCESVIDPQFSAFVREIVRSQVVPVAEQPPLSSEVTRIAGWRDAWLPEFCLFLLAALIGVATPQQNLFAYLPGYAGGSSETVVGAATWTSQWYWMACMTLFRFLLLRWLWRLALWCFFLWRVSRIGLHLQPTHPDRAGGLGYLELVHDGFAALVLAISATQSATLAEEIGSGRMTFDAIYASVGFVLVAEALLFLGPLYIFSPVLRECRMRGIRSYSVLGERYVNEFEHKWLEASSTRNHSLLGTSDIQSLVDLTNSVDIIRDMRTVPISSHLLIYLGSAALLPLLPLALFKYPLVELLEKFLERLVGL